MPITIRPVTADDWREMKRIRLLALATDRLAFGATMEQESAFADQVWIDRARASALGRDVTTWVAEGDDHRLVGMMGAHVGADGARGRRRRSFARRGAGLDHRRRARHGGQAVREPGVRGGGAAVPEPRLHARRLLVGAAAG